MNKIICYFTIALSCVALKVASADEKISHDVDFPKGDAAWVVTLAMPSIISGSNVVARPLPPGKAVKGRFLVKVDIVRQGNIRRDLAAWSDGSTEELWWSKDPPFVLLQEGTGGRLFARKAGNMSDQLLDESLFDWVGANTYVGMRAYNWKKCRYYQEEITTPDGTRKILRIWIDNDTAQPMAWANGETEAIFTFAAHLPTDPLVMPERFQKEFKRVASFY